MAEAKTKTAIKSKRMYEDFGAGVVGSSVTFKLFFPDNTIDPSQFQRGGLPKINRLRVAGNFQSQLGGIDWDYSNAPVLERMPHLHGWLYLYEIPNIPDGFYEYKYFVEFENGTTRWCSDPCSKYGGFENENSGFVVGGNKIITQPIKERLPLKNLIIYELMLDDFTAEFRNGKSPLDALLDKLDYLRDLGINAVEFMPWTTWPEGEFSWGYDPVSFFSVEYNYYNDLTQPLKKLNRLKVLINELHNRGIHVIMDGVFNHANAGIDPNKGFAYFWLYQDPADSPYIGNFGDAGFFNEFDFANNCTDQFIIDVCKYWLSDYCIDGIRFDYVKGFYIADDPNQGIGEIILYLKQFTKASGLENISFSLELLPDNRYEAIGDTNKIDASGCWFDPIMWELINAGSPGKVATSLMRALYSGKDFNIDKGPVIYIENHDHSTLTEQCGGRDQWFVTQPMAIALFTICGAVFIHNGQEFGEQYWFPESGDGRIMRRPLRWEKSDDGIGQKLLWLYKKLIDIRKQHPILTSPNFYPDIYDFSLNEFNEQGYGISISKGIVIYHRWGDNNMGDLERYIIILNFSSFDQILNIPFSENGSWQDLLSDTTIQVQNYSFENYLLNSNWGCIFKLLE